MPLQDTSAILILITLLQYIHCQHWSKHAQEHLDDNDNHKQTLIWGVSIHPQAGETRQQIESLVDSLAKETELLRYQQIFTHNFHHHLLCHPGYIHQRPSNDSVINVKTPRFHADFNQTAFVQKTHNVFDNHKLIQWYSQQILRPRVKRSIKFDDPAYPSQWHLNNRRRPSMDINVTAVWEHNVTGVGVTVAVVDDGLEWTNEDIRDNYSPEGSIDLDSNDNDPTPSQTSGNHHGTRCAGEIAAVANRHCGVGVAYKAKVSGIRVLDGAMTDSMEAAAFDAKLSVNDIYSCSWGPEDDGKTVDGPHPLAKIALKQGVDFGRRGYGSIFVVASGNGGRYTDNCNFDGYANSIYTVTIGAVDETGAMPYYAEECASMLAVTFSSGNGGAIRNIVTTDTSFGEEHGCTSRHTGTSAAAPIAAGLVALMLQVQPCLTWRDVQHIVAVTAVKVDIDVAHWTRNKAGLHHSHKHGFGLLDAWRLVNAAKVWKPVPWLTSYSTPDNTINQPIPKLPDLLNLTIEVPETNTSDYMLHSLEHIVVTVTISHPKRGQLEIRLVCPSGMESVIASYREVDRSSNGFQSWSFSTVRCWGETPYGVYQLLIKDKDMQSSNGQLIKWQLTLHGSAMTPNDVKNRIKSVIESFSGAYLNDSYRPLCPQARFSEPAKYNWVEGERVLKFLTLTGAFFLVLSVYQTFEYMFCYQDEKREQEKTTRLIRRAQYLSLENQGDSTEAVELSSTDMESDTTRLLAASEGIPLQTFQSSQGESTIERVLSSGRERLPKWTIHSDNGYIALPSNRIHSSCEEPGSSVESDQVLSDNDQKPLVVDLSQS